VDPVIDQLQQAAAAQLQAEEAENLSALADASNKRKLEDGENDVEMELKKVKRVIKEKDERIEALEQQVALIQKQLQLRNGEHHFEDWLGGSVGFISKDDMICTRRFTVDWIYDAFALYCLQFSFLKS